MTIRIIHKDGRTEVVRQSHSQMCETVKGATREQFRKLLNGESVDLPIGNVKFVAERG